uniref:EF-hand calcium binding domain 14 n=1 Tax=Leptobrachium leishanense TaxID=445787 RepID=A0A8C5PYC6_9ANUR
MGSGALSAGPQAPPTPHKKMKKRKELNALIGLAGDGGRRKPKASSGHRLLRTEPPASDSDSDSEEDGFSSPGGRHGRCGRSDFLQCCRVCYPLCAFIVLAACVVTCVGLVWMQVSLKENMDVLKEKFRVMESSQKNSLQEIPKINDDLLAKQKHLDEIVTGDMGLNKLWTNITEMNKQIELLVTAVNHLKANMKSAADLINLPNTMAELQKSVATLGSTLTSVHHDVETMQTAADEQKKKVETLQQDVSKLAVKESSEAAAAASPTSVPTGGQSLTQEVSYLHNSVEDVNATVIHHQKQNEARLHSLDSGVANVSQRVSALENDVHLLQRIHTKDNVSLAPGPSQEPSSSDLQEELQLIQALTNKPEGGQPSAEDASNSNNTTLQPVTSRRSRRSRKRRQESFSLSGIFTERDLKEFFRRAAGDIAGKLSYQELKDSLGSGVPRLQAFKEFDMDEDHKYSFSELKAALGF